LFYFRGFLRKEGCHLGLSIDEEIEIRDVLDVIGLIGCKGSGIKVTVKISFQKDIKK